MLDRLQRMIARARAARRRGGWSLVRRRLDRELDHHSRAAIRCLLHIRLPAVEGGQLANDSEPDATSLVRRTPVAS